MAEKVVGKVVAVNPARKKVEIEFSKAVTTGSLLGLDGWNETFTLTEIIIRKGGRIKKIVREVKPGQKMSIYIHDIEATPINVGTRVFHTKPPLSLKGILG